MLGKMGLSRILALIGAMGLAAAVALGSPVAIGSLVGSKNATLDGQVPLPRSTVLNGDNLQVNNDGLAMVALDQGNRMVLGRGTKASFTRDAEGVMVSMTSGNMSLFHPQASKTFRVKTGDVTVLPVPGYKTLGELAMVNGLLVVTAKDGALQVEKAGTTKKVIKGQTITIATTADRAPTPVPPGNRHIKHILNHKALIILGVGAEAGGVIAAIALVSTGPSRPAASPVLP